jgi:hypothetical protein
MELLLVTFAQSGINSIGQLFPCIMYSIKYCGIDVSKVEEDVGRSRRSVRMCVVMPAVTERATNRGWEST